MSSTPMIAQYKKVKENHKDSILLYRLGDFYETFYEDAPIASKVLGITLTARNREKGENIPMAGFPYHAAGSYIAKLVEAGYKVAICEQLEEPSGRGIVKREVTKIITPGTFSEIDFLDAKSSNYIASFCAGVKGASISYLDLTTGEFNTVEIISNNFERKAFNELFRIFPKEIILGTIKNEKLKKEIQEHCDIKKISYSEFQIEKDAENFLKEYFKIISLKPFNLEDKKYSAVSAASLLKYVSKLQNVNSITKINYIDFQDQMHLDYSSQENLDLIKDKKCSLLTVLDRTRTAMGARLLKRFITSPLINKEEILRRQEDIQFFINNPILRDEVSRILVDVYDVERLLGKILRREANARDLTSLKYSFKAYLKLTQLLENFLNINSNELLPILSLLENAIVETTSTSIKDGEIIKPEYDKELEELYKISTKGQDYILELEAKEREKSGIKGLKIRYNKIFGYYIEVSALNAHLVPKDYIRRQTLSNAERYITLELKEYEDKVLGAKEKINVLECEIFKDILEKVAFNFSIIEAISRDLSYLDVIISLTEVSLKNRYIRPEIVDERIIHIKEGRHPIVEYLEKSFIPNDLSLNEGEIIILTGPNMSGKSTYMKQVALIILLAQIGCYVPASYAKIGIVDKIFTRVGASDDLSTGQSTFMIEMNEVSNILNNATSRSFIILDEVGRGTSTFDGIAIAKAMTEYIHNKIGAKTIFATHYHELNVLEKTLEKVQNYRFEVSEEEDRVVFLKKIVKGSADRSYGVEVARLAGLPHEVLERSKELLSDFSLNKPTFEKVIYKDLFNEEKQDEIHKILEELNIENLTPLEAFRKLLDLKEKLVRR